VRIEARVITRAKKEEVEKISENNYRIKVSLPPEKGKANKRVIELLSKEFYIKKKDIKKELVEQILTLTTIAQ